MTTLILEKLKQVTDFFLNNFFTHYNYPVKKYI